MSVYVCLSRYWNLVLDDCLASNRIAQTHTSRTAEQMLRLLGMMTAASSTPTKVSVDGLHWILVRVKRLEIQSYSGATRILGIAPRNLNELKSLAFRFQTTRLVAILIPNRFDSVFVSQVRPNRSSRWLARDTR